MVPRLLAILLTLSFTSLGQAAEPFATLRAAFWAASFARIEDYPKIVELARADSKIRCIAVSEGEGVNTPDQIERVWVGSFTETRLTTVLYHLPDLSTDEDAYVDLYKRLGLSLQRQTSGELQSICRAGRLSFRVTYRLQQGLPIFHTEGRNDWGNYQSYGYCFVNSP